MVFSSTSQLAIVLSLIMIVFQSLYSQDSEYQKIYPCMNRLSHFRIQCHYKRNITIKCKQKQLSPSSSSPPIKHPQPHKCKNTVQRSQRKQHCQIQSELIQGIPSTFRGHVNLIEIRIRFNILGEVPLSKPCTGGHSPKPLHMPARRDPQGRTYATDDAYN